ncbi:MAG: DUF2071 domain-containing protein [Ktedonobacteraceae bacterium]
MNARAILQDIAHRLSPLPTGPWVMTQIWHELLFAHWPIAPNKLRPLVPPVFKLDTFEREAWVGVVPFHMSNVRPRGLPAVQKLSQFPELNVRTYVTVNGIPGVYFFSLDADNPIAVSIARTVFHLPYFNAAMSSKRVDDTIYYNSHRIHRGAAPADYIVTYRPIAPIEHAAPHTLPFWLTERYYLYTLNNHQRVFRGDIHHALWPLQAAELETTTDTMALSHKIELPNTAPLLHYSHRQEVLIWPLRHVDIQRDKES